MDTIWVHGNVVRPQEFGGGNISSPGRGVAGAKNDLKNLLNKFDVESGDPFPSLE